MISEMQDTQPVRLKVGASRQMDRRWTLVFAALVMLVTSLPYFLGYAFQGADYRFTGFVFAVEDGNSYIAKMLSGASGAWMFRTPYTVMPQPGVWMFLPYILLGKLAAPPALHEQLVALYHLFRLAAGFLMILATDDFLAFFIRDARLRRFGLVLATLGGGLGWLLMFTGQDHWLGSLPLDIYSPETFGFLGLYGIPHLALARALLLWALLAYLRAAVGDRRDVPTLRSAARIAGLWLLAGLVQPLTTLVIGAVIALHAGGLGLWAWLRRQKDAAGWEAWKHMALLVALAGIFPALLVFYNAWAMWRDPFVQAWTAQNIIRSPHPAHYLAAYGLLLPLVLLGGRRALAPTKSAGPADAPAGWLLVGWALALPLLAYMPVNLQRRLPEGEWVVWVTLALLGLEGLILGRASRSTPGERRRSLFLPLGIVAASVLFLTTLLLLLTGFMGATRLAHPVFRPRDEVRMFEFLARQALPGDVVLSAFETGNALPAWAPLRVVIGHGPESGHLAEIQPQVAAFYQVSSSDAWRQEFLRQFGVQYVFWGPAERKLGDWNLAQANYLELAAQAGEYSLFHVRVP